VSWGAAFAVAAITVSQGETATAAATDPIDYTRQARTLARVVACAPTGEVPPDLDKRTVAGHCRAMQVIDERWRRKWLGKAQPFLAKVVPRDVPPKIVYPFGGGDLVSALVTFPDAVEITTLSLEPAGDPSGLESIPREEMEAALTDVRQAIRNLLAVSHSKTSLMKKLARGRIPGQLTYTLEAMALMRFEPVSMRFFRLRPDGGIDYLSERDLQIVYPAGPAREAAFNNVEIEFVPQGQADAPRRTFRHIAANLADKHLAADPCVLRHLEQKGEITAITKAASYLLWWKEFSAIRGYLLRHMAWMISDSTGIPPEHARAAGFEQIAYGRFEGPFMGRRQPATDDFVKLWARAAPMEPPFRYGYPDSADNSHLLVTRRRPGTDSSEAAPPGAAPASASAAAGAGTVPAANPAADGGAAAAPTRSSDP
jgi:hypothetical protein